MGHSTITGARLAGLACAVPMAKESIDQAADRFGADQARKVADSVGVRERHLSPAGMCTSDLCYAAGVRVLQELGWEASTVDALVFVSQTPDYVLPATSALLHARLGLPKAALALDLSQGCTGYVHGLWLASQILAGTSARRVLLLVGDTLSKLVSPGDRATYLLFGDGGSATALEAQPDAPNMVFEYGTDGTGGGALIVPGGGFRHPGPSLLSRQAPQDKLGDQGSRYLLMDGPEVFAFTLREVPPMVHRLLNTACWNKDSVDAWVFHQANQFIVQYLAKKLNLPSDKVILAMSDFGNTSSASIPLVLTHALRSRLVSETLNLVLVGFGVGFAWASAALICDRPVIPELLYVDEIDLS